MPPEFSIITVCFNSEKTIQRTLQSVLDQTYENYEYIIVDGASTDRTIDIVRSFMPLFNGKMRVISEPDQGIYDAMNKGIRNAKGTLIGMVNSDDYYEPDALENILKTARGFAEGRIVTLFGCGGDRDHAKRPIMGEIAGRFSDFLVVTSDNPRTEDPMTIIEAVLEGVRKSSCPYVVVENRYEAIRYALEHAQPKDVIILAGKGHENYQEIGSGKRHFDEKEIVAELLGTNEK